MENFKGYHTYEELIELIKKSDTKYNLKIIDEAYKTAKEAHKNQKRVSGLEYIYHPISVAYILVELGMDMPSVVAGLLHDSIEDTPITKKDITNLFGLEISNLVDGVTKLRKIPSRSDEEQQAEDLRKMLLAMSKDIRVILIKLADRLQNMRTIGCMPIEKQRTKSLQNMEVFAPIAHRLGIRTIKDELEDISLKCLDPAGFEEVETCLSRCKIDGVIFIESIKKKIMENIKQKINNPYVEGRVKSANEIYKKMFIKGKTMEQIYDVYAVRVIVNSISECYNVFGIIHDMFQPIPKRFKDYISTPKANMYQSLHTTVMSKNGIPFEVQIRTWKMHQMAEYGIAAHWKYKLERITENSSFGKSLLWIQKLIENYRTVEDVTDIVGSIKSDLVPKEIFILTPKGGVITLPIGSTVIDFAYAVHTELGNKLIGAKVNEKIMPLNYILKTGEIVEVISTKDPNKGPNRDWLNIVKTTEAKNKIRHWFKLQCREENIKEGKEKFELELSKHGINIDIFNEKSEEFLKPTLRKKQFNSLDDFFASVGYGGIQLWKIMPRIKQEYLEIRKEEGNVKKEVKTNKISNNFESVVVDGLNGCYVKFAKCCTALPGDEIIGFITKGYGVSVHKKECKNLKSISSKDKKRLIKISWNKNVNRFFEICIEVTADESKNFLTNLTKKISHINVKLISLNSKIGKDGQTNAFLTLNVKNPQQLKFIIDNLSNIENVINVRRI